MDYGFLQEKNPDDPADQGSNPILMGAEAKFGSLWRWQFHPFSLLLKREGSITIFEHPEEGEEQSNHLAEGSVNIVTVLIRTLKSSTESNFRTEIGPSHPLIPCIIEHAAQLKNRYMVGADGGTPTGRLRGRGVQRPVHELGEKVLFFTSCSCPTRRLWRKVRLWDLPGLQIIRWPGVHWNTLRSHQMQDVATAQRSGEMGRGIRAVHQRNPVVSMRSVPQMSTSV